MFTTLLVLACTYTPYDPNAVDSGAPDPETDTDTDTDADTDSDTDADSDTDTDTDADTDTPVPDPILTELDDPCSGHTVQSMRFTSAEEGLVGCYGGEGIWSTSDAGDSFTEALSSGNFYVARIVPDPTGGTLVCGHDYAPSTDVFVYRYLDGAWTELLHYGSNTYDPTAAQMSGCGAIAADDAGRILVASETSGDMTHSEDGGLTWTAEDRYWEDDNLQGGYAYHYMLNLMWAGGRFLGAGSSITEPPTFFAPSPVEGASWYNFEASTLADFSGEIWALGTPDDGTTLFAGGRDQGRSSEASGFLFRSTDGGVTWTDVSFGGTTDIVHDVVFDADGLHGVAVGHRYPPGSLGGFVATTEDGGETWTLEDVDVPPLYTAAIAMPNWFVGGEGYLARGTFE